MIARWTLRTPNCDPGTVFLGAPVVHGMVRRGRDRGQSEILGYVVIAGIAVALATVVFVAALLVLNDGQIALGSGQGAEVVSLAAGRAGLVTQGYATAQTVDAGGGTGGQFFVRADAGHIRIDHNHSGWRDDEVLLDTDLGTLSYETGDRRVALQGGGVWRNTRDGTALVRDPSLHHRNRTLAAPVTRLNGTDAATGGPTIVLSEGRAATPRYPDGSERYNDSTAFMNPVENGTVRIAVSGRYYEGWGEYFREEFNGSVSVYDGNRTAVVALEGGRQVRFLHVTDARVDVRFD